MTRGSVGAAAELVTDSLYQERRSTSCCGRESLTLTLNHHTLLRSKSKVAAKYLGELSSHGSGRGDTPGVLLRRDSCHALVAR